MATNCNKTRIIETQQKALHAKIRYVRLFSVLILVFSILSLSGCGVPPEVQSGTFVNSRVAGLTYKTPSQSGVTDVSGKFSYMSGETVTFSIGNTVLGTAAGAAIITPTQLVPGTVDITNQAVTNIGRLLQTFDEDGDLSNGITINANTAGIVSTNAAGLDFNQTAETFAADPKVIATLVALNASYATYFTSMEAGGRKLRSATEAQAHLKASTAPRKEVTTAFGTLSGFALDNDAWVWKGVPYASPPVGDLRWKAPLDPAPWTGVREATAAASECTQQVYDQYWRSVNAFTGSEDCLYLDIYRPKTDTTNLPVYVFIHGGSNNFGSAKDYSGAALAKRGDIITIVIQYRVSALGFLTHPALRTSGTAEDRSGNYGTLDQLKALNWIHNNIAAFGGDPDKVVVGGQSSGAGNTLSLIVSPLSEGLFRGAFLQSVGMVLNTVSEGDGETHKTILGLLVRDRLATDEASAETYLAYMSDDQIETYLRGKTAEQILRARKERTGLEGSGIMPPHDPIRDDYVVRNMTSAEAIAAGKYNKVPIVIGSTQDEWKDFMPVFGDAAKALTGGTVPSSAYTWSDLFKVIGVGGKLGLTDVLPEQADRDLYETLADLKSRQFRANVDLYARALKTNDSSNKIYAYLFDWSGGGDPSLTDFNTIFGASHSMDIAFFQGQNWDNWNYSFTEANQSGRVALQGAMMDYLISFVKTLDPNPSGSDLPVWKEWEIGNGGSQAITFNADLNNYLLNIASTENASAGLSEDIAAARVLYPITEKLFYLFGLVTKPEAQP